MYHLPDDYVRNLPPGLDTHPDGYVRNPLVPLRAADLARFMGVTTIAVVGCALAQQYAPLADEFTIVGFDCDEALEPLDVAGQWLTTDFERPDCLIDLEVPAVWVCCDLIEHLAHPEHVVRALRDKLGGGNVAMLATPDRERVRGRQHRGPAPNRGHVQEWTLVELTEWLHEEGWAIARAEHIQSNNREPAKATCLVEAT